MAQIPYGAGLRLMECIRLRVKDTDFGYQQITYRTSCITHHASAINTCWLMDANHLTTFGTDPFLFFIPNEMSDPEFIYHSEIVEHAHSILCSVPLVQMFQLGAGKNITTIGTIPDFVFGDLFAVSDFTASTVY
ncbi:hypothetical protein QUF80_14650 [Desulfococcaceae bacterium HSG8]|nr:hypothetical protein [Desulfococcaceae bacterium HSG8]